MPIGDTGGFASVLIIQCMARVGIEKGDAVSFLENYMVTNKDGELFGQALKSAKEGDTVPILTRGILSFNRSKVLPDPGKVERWVVKEGKLVPLLIGKPLKVLFENAKRVDILV